MELFAFIILVFSFYVLFFPIISGLRLALTDNIYNWTLRTVLYILPFFAFPFMHKIAAMQGMPEKVLHLYNTNITLGVWLTVIGIAMAIVGPLLMRIFKWIGKRKAKKENEETSTPEQTNQVVEKKEDIKNLSEYAQEIQNILTKYEDLNKEESKGIKEEITKLVKNLKKLKKVEKYDETTVKRIEKFCDVYLPVLIKNLERGLRFYADDDTYSKLGAFTKDLNFACDKIIKGAADQNNIETHAEMEGYKALLKSQGYLGEEIMKNKAQTN